MSQAHLLEIYLARHGETAWAITGQHTGRTDIPLTERGERNAASLGERLAGIEFTEVMTSPLVRAARTCALAGYESKARLDPDLMEWDYGNFEGLKTAEIRQGHPHWFLFRDGSPGGESVLDIGLRADRVIAHLREIEGKVLLFSHGHFGRVLAARWLGLTPGDARLFLLGTAALSILSYDHNPEEPVIKLWNDTRHVKD